MEQILSGVLLPDEVDKKCWAFHFSIQLNENHATLCGHDLGSKKGFEYVSAIPKTSVEEDVPNVDIEAAHISQVVQYGDFSVLGV